MCIRDSTEHEEATGSPLAKRILENFDSYTDKFKKIMPIDYNHMLQSISQMEEKGMSREQAEIEAFYMKMCIRDRCNAAIKALNSFCFIYCISSIKKQIGISVL